MLSRDTVREGETLVSLSARLLGDPFQWRTLVRVNDLRPPYLTPEPRRGCLSPGESVYYPGAATPASVNVPALVARTYKRDLATSGRDLVLDGGRLVTRVGVANLQDAVMRRVRTLVGRHPFHPEYGSLASLHVGRVADAPRLRLLCVDTRRAVLQDPRVRECQVTAAFQVDELFAVVTVTPINPGEPFVVRVPITA